MSDDLVKQLLKDLRNSGWYLAKPALDRIKKLEADLEIATMKRLLDSNRIEKLEDLLALYRDAVLIDATMQGPIFRGANSSALKRAWYHDCKALEREDD